MEDSLLQVVLETELDCNELAHKFFYNESLMKQYYESDEDDTSKSNRFVELLKELADKILRVIVRTVDGINHLFGSSKDNISPREFKNSGVADIVMSEYNEDIMRETKVQCKLGRAIINGIAKTGIVKEDEVNAYLNKGAKYLNSKEGKYKVKASIAPSVYAFTTELKDSAAKDLVDFNNYKGKSISDAGKTAIVKVYTTMNKYKSKACTWSNMYMKQYSKLTKEENRK